MYDDRNIVLIGMPGSGKSTTGIVLAKTLGYGFVDTDVLIQDSCISLLQEIIDSEGIERFLEIEEKSIVSSSFRRTVIATGGSAVLSPGVMLHLKSPGIAVYLELDYAAIEERINNIGTRGIVMPAGQTLRDVYDLRRSLYEEYADITVSCGGRSLENIVSEIVSRL